MHRGGELNLRGKVLIVEDSQEIASLISRALTEEGFETTAACSAQNAFRLLDSYWDVVILDLGLPDVSGEEVLTYIARGPHPPPVLIVTARLSLEDKLTVFRRGCDDYLTKPFEIEELLQRVGALLRRSTRTTRDSVSCDDMVLDAAALRLHVGKNAIILTPKEASICEVLMREPGKIVSRKELLHTVWGITREPETNFVSVHLINLRRKFQKLGRAEWLRTIRGSGMCIERPKTKA